MSTKQPRLNVVLEPGVYYQISKLSKKEGVSMSLLARDLLRESLLIYEDLHWAKQAESREKSMRGRKTLTHNQLWGIRKA